MSQLPHTQSETRCEIPRRLQEVTYSFKLFPLTYSRKCLWLFAVAKLTWKLLVKPRLLRLSSCCVALILIEECVNFKSSYKLAQEHILNSRANNILWIISYPPAIRRGSNLPNNFPFCKFQFLHLICFVARSYLEITYTASWNDGVNYPKSLLFI